MSFAFLPNRPLGGNLRLRHLNKTPREFAHPLEGRLGFRRGFGHVINLRLAWPPGRRDRADVPRGCCSAGGHAHISRLRFPCPTFPQAIQCRRDRPRHLSLAPCPTIDRCRLHAEKSCSLDLCEFETLEESAKLLGCHRVPRTMAGGWG